MEIRPHLHNALRGLAGFALAAVWARPALAHDPPAAATLIDDPSGEVAVIVTNRGLIFRDPEAGTYHLLCNGALDVPVLPVLQAPQVTILSDGRLLAATTSASGLQVTEDGGCTWQGVSPFADSATPALAVHPMERDTVYVAGSGAMSGIHVTRDGGNSFEPLIALDPADFMSSLLVSSTDPNWIYATGFDTAAQPFAHFLLRSQDGGANWERIALPQHETYYQIRILAVDPRDPQRIVLSSETNTPKLEPSQLLFSEQGGDAATVAFESLEIADAVFDAEGRLWVAAQEGLFAGDDPPTGGFTRTTDAAYLSCIQRRGDALIACGHYAGPSAPSGVGMWATPGGAPSAFTTWMDFTQVDAPVECAASTDANALCQGLWADWQAEILTDTPPAGAGTGGAGGGTAGGALSAGDMPMGTAGRGTGGAPATVAGSGSPGTSASGDGGGCSVLADDQGAQRGGFALVCLLGCCAGLAARHRARRCRWRLRNGHQRLGESFGWEGPRCRRKDACPRFWVCRFPAPR